MLIKNLEDYHRVYADSLRDSDAFWDGVGRDQIQWHKHWLKVSDCDYRTGQVQWYLGAELNVSENCLDRHIAAGKGNHKALIWVGNEPGEERVLTFNQLYSEVCRMAHGLEGVGIQKGDRVVIYLPNIPELAISVLACARIGAIHSVIFGGFSAHSIRDRVEDCGAKLIITANGTYRGTKWIDLKSNVDEAVESGCSTVQSVVVFNRNSNHPFELKKRDISWEKFLPASLPIDQFKSFAISERKNMPLSKAGSFDIFLSILFAKRVKSFKLVA